ncbi:hypothetical protein [Roseibium sp. TrichSKD4]|uniref:hypothetical protein n=1 Tax=Roseibium sp. TrichSKD4 TaxID=744980 RepID=UPI0006824157|nr:hypothetical protein [Roseibium sp. TrichSKD4]
MWHGPAWVLGTEPPAAVAGCIFSNSIDLGCLIDCGGNSADLADIPSAILVSPAALHENDQAFWAILNSTIDALPCEVPLILLSEAQDTLPDAPKPHAVVNVSISPNHLFQTMCDLQRTILRTEEATLRRSVFGRVHDYGTVPHREGPSSLLIVGLGQRFLEIQNLSQDNVEVVGAFNQAIAEDYLTQRGFDAVILDSSLQENMDNLRQLRLDARFATLPALVFADHPADIVPLFDLGATDVLTDKLTAENLKYRMQTAIRSGECRRQTDGFLAESHRWLIETNPSGGMSRDLYNRYLDEARSALKLRGLDVHELQLLPHSLLNPLPGQEDADNLWSTVLSIADAASREEDLICVVEGLGPVAVLKNDRGKTILKSRINAILTHTIL